MTKALKKTKYLSLYKTEQGFIYSERRNVNSVAVLCYKRVKGKVMFLIRMQPLPQVNTYKFSKWDTLYPCPITGSMEKNKTPLEVAINEIYEEANLIASKKNLKASSLNVATTQMNETVFNYLFDVTNCKKVNKKQGDGSIFESVSKNVWVDEKQLVQILKNKDKKLFLSSLAACYFLYLNK